MKRIALMLMAVAVMTFIAACGTSAPTATQAPVISQSATQPAAVPSTAASGAAVSFANDVMPILSNNCTKCHGVDQVKAGLDMTTYAGLMSGSMNGPVIVAGNAGNSLLIDLVTKGKMPKRGTKLTPAQIQIITNWINTGALNN